MKRFMSALAVGAVLRVAALPLGGTSDVPIFKGWSYTAAVRGPATLYDWAAAREDRSLRRVGGFSAEGDYPPLSLYAFGLVGLIYTRATGEVYADSPALTAAVKTPALAAEIALAVLLFVVARRRSGAGAPRAAVLALWLNPAVILATAVLGFTDPMFVLPALAAIVAASARRGALAGSLAAASALTKPQGLLMAPVVALAVWNAGEHRSRQIARACTGAALTSLVVLFPIAAAGAIGRMVLAVGSNMLGADLLSAGACNVWWIVGHLVQVSRQGHGTVWSLLSTQATMLPISALMDFESPEIRIAVRLLGAVPAAGAAAWGLWTVRHVRSVWMHAAAAAFLVHAYVVLTPQVHDNHLYAVVPLLALAATGHPRFAGLLVIVSVVLALNLNLLYGFEDGRYAIPRGAVGADLMLLVSIVNCAALVWHAAVLRDESRRRSLVDAPTHR